MSETVIGPHLLGRKPSLPDARDYRLEHFPNFKVTTSDGDLVLAAIAELVQTKKPYTYFTALGIEPGPTTHWYKAFAKLYEVPGVAPVPPPAPTVVNWANVEPVLDQGNFGTCVGNGWAQWGNTEPVDDHYVEKDARAIYYESTIIGGSPDNPDAPGGGQQGSTVRDGAKAMQNRKRLDAYAFAATTDTITAYVSNKGSVVAGTDWTADMFTPNADGFIVPTGSIEGGHCYLLDAYDPDKHAYGFENSWGNSWGKGGYFWMLVSDFAKLLAQGGEACAALELA